MELGSVIQVLENKTILVTGATGFLAKIFVEKILRVQPNVKKLYLLVRAADAKSASQRLQNEVCGQQRKCSGAHHIYIISYYKICNFIIKFYNINYKMCHLVINERNKMFKIFEYIIRLSNQLKPNQLFNSSYLSYICFLNGTFVFSAYVSGERAGLNLEKPFYMGETINGTLGLDIEMEKKIVAERLSELRGKETTEAEITLTMKDLGIERARKYGWPNTYVFTKAMGEMLLGEMKENEMPIVILRPTIITSTYKEPFPGWIEGLRTVDSLIVGYGKGKLTFFPGDLECILDLIPADMVVNSMVVAMAAHANKPNCREMMIYQVGSSVSNPIKLEYIKDYSQSYFKKHPWIGRDGKPIKVGQVTLLTSMATFHKYMAIRYLLPLKGLRAVNTTFCHYFHGMYVDLHRKIKFVMRMIELYQPYLFFKGVYDDTNTEKLQMTVKESSVETKVFYFDPKIINWEDYFMNIHIPGVVKSMLM
ncbi:alcohol-forming fatty acyl-CoA reductase-like [Camellia sinensis]|uniref:alcohol-forming fatty acyl-CoA reductase-like n=1 Tax=Camellia sinensis TaxID=4442 RepID=UPI0010369EE5|nr:alcohol-forming fatty acyl-CoA reductase-like [Camellia sinensis]